MKRKQGDKADLLFDAKRCCIQSRFEATFCSATINILLSFLPVNSSRELLCCKRSLHSLCMPLWVPQVCWRPSGEAWLSGDWAPKAYLHCVRKLFLDLCTNGNMEWPIATWERPLLFTKDWEKHIAEIDIYYLLPSGLEELTIHNLHTLYPQVKLLGLVARRLNSLKKLDVLMNGAGERNNLNVEASGLYLRTPFRCKKNQLAWEDFLFPISLTSLTLDGDGFGLLPQFPQGLKSLILFITWPRRLMMQPRRFSLRSPPTHQFEQSENDPFLRLPPTLEFLDLGHFYGRYGGGQHIKIPASLKELTIGIDWRAENTARRQNLNTVLEFPHGTQLRKFNLTKFKGKYMLHECDCSADLRRALAQRTYGAV